jgi:hypothetical protein
MLSTDGNGCDSYIDAAAAVVNAETVLAILQ